MRHLNSKVVNRVYRYGPGLRLPVFVLAACLQLTAFYCQADSYLLVKSGTGEIYTRFEKSLGIALTNQNPQNSLAVRDVKDFESQQNVLSANRFDTIISAGIEASMAVSELHTDTPTLMVMLPRESYLRLSASGDIVCEVKSCRVVFLDQPIARQLQFIKLVLPGAKQVAVMSSSQSSTLVKDIGRAAGKVGLRINDIVVTDTDSVLSTLKQDLANSDVLLTIPDPIIYNRDTARAILLYTFYQHIPLLAYSRSFVRAGATFGIYSTPEDIARHVAELVSSKATKPNSPQGLYPKYFTIDINRRAADALGISLQDSEQLAKRLQAYEHE